MMGRGDCVSVVHRNPKYGGEGGLCECVSVVQRNPKYGGEEGGGEGGVCVCVVQRNPKYGHFGTKLKCPDYRGSLISGLFSGLTSEPSKTIYMLQEAARLHTSMT